jgi:hypothetical protein
MCAVKRLAPIDLALLCLGERDIHGRQALPQLFNELKALINRQAADV